MVFRAIGLAAGPGDPLPVAATTGVAVAGQAADGVPDCGAAAGGPTAAAAEGASANGARPGNTDAAATTTPAATDSTLAMACSPQPGSDVDIHCATREARLLNAESVVAVPDTPSATPLSRLPPTPSRARWNPSSPQPKAEPPDRSYSRRSAARARKTSVSVAGRDRPMTAPISL
ncbi:MAG: hypothetical protein QOF96_3745 [Actinomycetota bacterium]|nr:hypothetical protein [Actinomycetota bacterium]